MSEGLLPTHDIAAAVDHLIEAHRVRDGKYNETVTRETLVAGMNRTFVGSTPPWWVKRAILGAEHGVKFAEGGINRRGRADSVVGLTAIEYEYDLRQEARYTTGRHQVAQYCTGLLNEGHQLDKIRGVLSDGVEWIAYRLDEVEPRDDGTFEVEDVQLVELERIDCNADERSARDWIRFLSKYLGREGVRPLAARSISAYFGFDGPTGRRHLSDFQAAVIEAADQLPRAASLVAELWQDLTASLGSGSGEQNFPNDTYVQEVYLCIVSRLLCANALEERALRSNDDELEAIVGGEYFYAKGLLQLVEYDYFGWLMSGPGFACLRDHVRQLQNELLAFDFSVAPTEDLFGELMSSLAERTQKLLLGQEWTPAWLAYEMARHLVEQLPAETEPEFIDMSCGSGSMLVAVTRIQRERLAARGLEPGSREARDLLMRAATGFDIDPLAATLAKVNWVLTNREWLAPFDGADPIAVPVYVADSLFEVGHLFTPYGPGDDADFFELALQDQSVSLPRTLVAPRSQAVFDQVLQRCHSLAMVAAQDSGVVEDEDVAPIVPDVLRELGLEFDEPDVAIFETFALELTRVLTHLEVEGRNRIWPFILRNTLRPGLIAGQFNGLISNPPWLALSKIGDNPFADVLTKLAAEFGIEAPGSAFPHQEMATAFLAKAANHYLDDGARIACVLPETVRNGMHHQPLRAQLSGRVESPRIQMKLDSIWKLERDVFKNRALVVMGTKGAPTNLNQIEMRSVSATQQIPGSYRVVETGSRLIWTESDADSFVPNPYPSSAVNQGADLMPRRLVTFSAQTAAGNRMTISSPNRGEGDWYLVSDAKKHREFNLSPTTLPGRVVHPCLISKHLGHFTLAGPAFAVIPFMRAPDGNWRRASARQLAVSPEAVRHFERVVGASDFETLVAFQDALDLRLKLTRQHFDDDSWIVLYGAGGGYPAATFVDVSQLDGPMPIVDQTIYWMEVETKDEALYVSGMFNSEALLNRIKHLMPEGDFGRRHIHKLPPKATPIFDAGDDKHLAVAKNTLALIEELEALRGHTVHARLFTMEVKMKTRRGRQRELLVSLDTHRAYEEACAAIYEDLDEAPLP